MMEQVLERYAQVIGGGIVTALSVLIGGWDMPLQILIMLMGCDILSGLFKAWKEMNFSSRQFREGLMSKAGFFLVIILSYQLDLLISQGQPLIRTACILFYIGVEGVSLLENLGAVGVPIPEAIRKHLTSLQPEEENDKKEAN